MKNPVYWSVFLHDVEYPSSEDYLKGVPPNTFWEYVPSTYLNGLVNHVEPVRLWMLSRYENEGHKEAVSKIEKECHSKLCQHDDCILIGQSESESWVFWFDRDSSDCCVGRSDAPVEGMIAEVERRIPEDCNPFHQIDPKKITGWISW